MNALSALIACCVLSQTPVEEIARQIESRYVLVEEAARIARQLSEKARAGAYEGIQPVSKLAQALTSDLRTMSGDLHFAVEHDPALAARLVAAAAATSPRLPELERTAEELLAMRRTNYGFRRLEVLAGNVARIELTRFDDHAVSGPTAAAAMALAANADAVIIDLRENQGGKGNAVEFLASCFLPAGVELLSTFDRETGETTSSRTWESMPGERLLEAPLFLLIGPATGSAAEAFAFALQRLGRATVVGGKSAGAAQGGGWVPVGDGFVVFIPTFRSFDPRTGTNWEGTGVQPDVPTEIDAALAAAHLRAVAELDRRSSRQDLRWLLPLLDLAANGPASLELLGCAGRYQGIEISEAGGALKFLGASGIPRDLTPLCDGTLLIEDRSVPPESQARLRFIRDAAGAVTGLELLIQSGEAIPRTRL